MDISNPEKHVRPGNGFRGGGGQPAVSIVQTVWKPATFDSVCTVLHSVCTVLPQTRHAPARQRGSLFKSSTVQGGLAIRVRHAGPLREPPRKVRQSSRHMIFLTRSLVTSLLISSPGVGGYPGSSIVRACVCNS